VNTEIYTTSFVALWMWSKGNAPKSREPAFGFYFTTMLQHTGPFWSQISSQRTIWQHWSITHNLLTWFQLIFTCSSSTEISTKDKGLFDTTDIIKNATEELKRFSQNGFQECFQHLHSRWKKCTVSQGDYCEGYVAYIIVLFCISQK